LANAETGSEIWDCGSEETRTEKGGEITDDKENLLWVLGYAAAGRVFTATCVREDGTEIFPVIIGGTVPLSWDRAI
jgi:hypothetical protein